MKLDVLHETVLVGAVAFRPNILGKPFGDQEISRPRGKQKWYLAFSSDDPIDGLMEAEGEKSGAKVKTQFGKQTTKPKTLVWQPEEGQGRELTNKSLYVPPGTKKASQYTWPRTTFHGQSEGHAAHILK